MRPFSNGHRRHRERDATIEEIGEIIARAGSHKGNILIPAFAIGRTQEVLYQLGRHFDEWGLDPRDFFSLEDDERPRRSAR